jgi:hypothetical protein
LAKVLFQNVLQRAAPYPVAHGQFGGGFDQAIEGHNLGQNPSFAPEAGSSENLVQSQPLPNLMANVDCSRLAGLFDLNLIPINVAAALVLLWPPGSHLRFPNRDWFLRGVVQKALLAAQRALEMVREILSKVVY